MRASRGLQPFRRAQTTHVLVRWVSITYSPEYAVVVPALILQLNDLA
jgi:hypothetical protein